MWGLHLFQSNCRVGPNGEIWSFSSQFSLTLNPRQGALSPPQHIPCILSSPTFSSFLKPPIFSFASHCTSFYHTITPYSWSYFLSKRKLYIYIVTYPCWDMVQYMYLSLKDMNELFFGFCFLQWDSGKMMQQNVVVSDTKSGAAASVFPSTLQKSPVPPGGYISISRRRVLKNLEINGEHRINAWVESMRASSPTHLKPTPSLADEQSSWIVRTSISLINTHYQKKKIPNHLV